MENRIGLMVSALARFEPLHAVLICSSASQFLLVPFATQGSKWVLTNLRSNREEIPEGELGVGVKLWWSAISFCKEAICFIGIETWKSSSRCANKGTHGDFPFFIVTDFYQLQNGDLFDDYQLHIIVMFVFFFSCYSRGEVCTMAPLHLHEGMKEHPLYEQSLLALATLTKVQ